MNLSSIPEYKSIFCCVVVVLVVSGQKKTRGLVLHFENDELGPRLKAHIVLILSSKVGIEFQKIMIWNESDCMSEIV